MDDLIRHGVEARRDWEAYHTAVEGPDMRYHNRPDCEEGSLIADDDLRAGTDMRPLCEKCHTTEKPVGHPTETSPTWQA